MFSSCKYIAVAFLYTIVYTTKFILLMKLDWKIWLIPETNEKFHSWYATTNTYLTSIEQRDDTNVFAADNSQQTKKKLISFKWKKNHVLSIIRTYWTSIIVCLKCRNMYITKYKYTRNTIKILLWKYSSRFTFHL